MSAPLEDPTYEPLYRPINGAPNPIVARWSPASQLRWFKRFWGSDEMPTLSWKESALLHVQSVEHVDQCCSSCLGYDEEYAPDDHCCCKATR